MPSEQLITLKQCEYCKNLNPHISPPTTDQYQNGSVTVNNLSILLPDHIAKKRSKSGITIARCVYIKGFYCTFKCFLNALYDIIPWDKNDILEVH